MLAANWKPRAVALAEPRRWSQRQPRAALSFHSSESCVRQAWFFASAAAGAITATATRAASHKQQVPASGSSTQLLGRRSPEKDRPVMGVIQVLCAMPRAFQLYSAVIAVWWDYRRTRKRAEKMRVGLGLPAKTPLGEDDPPAVAALWEAAHGRNAPRARKTIDRLRGLWVKIGQYLSSRPDVTPSAYIEHLKGLQDSTVASPWPTIAATLREEFGQDWEKKVDVDEQPLAAASVAQVHEGRLKDGTDAKVAVKVQHRGVDVQMKLDLINLSILLGVLRRFDKEQDWRPLAKEWSSAVRSELDFRLEADNLREVSANMKRSGVKVIVPEPKDGWIARRALLMTFCEGKPARDSLEMEKLGANRDLFMERVCMAFASQIHNDGFFNADPHPGNVHVSTDPKQNLGDPSVPILLDYGLTKRFNSQMRLAFAQLMHASHTSDPDGLERSLENMGFIFERNPLEDLANMRRLFTVVPKSQVAEQRRVRQQELAQRKKEEKEVEENSKTGKGDMRKRRPVEAWPSELVFFLRVTGLLKGLASSLDVSVDYLGMMATAAKKTIRDSVSESCSGESQLLTRDTSLTEDCAKSRLQSRIESVLSRLHQSGNVLGMQVSVVRSDGTLLASACCGELGSADPRPVQPDSLFCVFSAGKAPCAATVLRLVEEGKLELSTPVAHYWPEFGVEGKENCTVEHVLRHRAGLASAMPARPSLENLLNLKGMEDFVAEAPPESTPGTKFSYHYLTFGWILAGLVRKIELAEFADVLRAQVSTPLGLESEMMLGVPQEVMDANERLAHLELNASPSASAGAPNSQSSGENSKRAAEAARAIPLLSPTLFNMRRIRSACVPAANMHCSARALARFYAGLAPGPSGASALFGAEMLRSLQLAGDETTCLPSDSSTYDSNPSSEFGLGMKLFNFSTKHSGQVLSGIGHAGLGGSVGLVIPDLGVGIAVTTNRLEASGNTPKSVLTEIFDELGVSAPAGLQPKTEPL